MHYLLINDMLLRSLFAQQDLQCPYKFSPESPERDAAAVATLGLIKILFSSEVCKKQT